MTRETLILGLIWVQPLLVFLLWLSNGWGWKRSILAGVGFGALAVPCNYFLYAK
jgi:hypothetical protein